MTDESLNSPEVKMSGTEFHVRSEELRERGNFLDAVTSAQSAESSYLEEGNPVKAAEACASEMLAYRHLYEQTGLTEHKDNARKAIEKGVEIMRNSGETVGMGIVLYNLAKFYQTEGDYERAVEVMRESLAAFEAAPNDPMGFPAQIAEIKARLSAFEYGAGDDTAYDRFHNAFVALKENPHSDEYTQKVWESGCYLHLAEALIRSQRFDEALEHLDAAELIVGEDERFFLRINQIEKLRSVIS